jgi:ATP-dependent RNA helicase DeaD
MQNQKEEALKNSLKMILAQEDLAFNQALIKRLTAELKVSTFDCASALSFLAQSEPSLDENRKEIDSKNQIESRIESDFPVVKSKSRFVRYRVEVGTMHKVLMDEIKAVLVDVSGVEDKQIGRMEIRNHYTLIDLPDGMPPDIFQLLSETKVRDRKLKLKRIKFQRRFQRRADKK